MGSERQAWTKEPWVSLSPPSNGANGALVRSETTGRIVAEFERHDDAIHAATSHNALTGIPDPQAWVEAVERLVRAVALQYDPGCSEREAWIQTREAYQALLALQSPREEEENDV